MYPTQFFIIWQSHFFPNIFSDLIHKLLLFQQEIFKVQNIVTHCLSHLTDRRGRKQKWKQMQH